MKIFLGSLILPIKERKIKELSFGLAINQHNSGKNNSKQLATQLTQRKVRACSFPAWAPVRCCNPASGLPWHWLCRTALTGLGGMWPRLCSPPSSAGQNLKKESEQRSSGLVGLLNTRTSPVCDWPAGCTLEHHISPGTTSIHFCPPFPSVRGNTESL